MCHCQDGCRVWKLFLRCVALAEISSSLIWPVIIAGSHMYGDSRTIVLDIFEAFRFVSLNPYFLAYEILTVPTESNAAMK